jgi:hypothetical protein
MVKTILDTPEKVLNYIRKNRLNELWTGWSNPKNINGIRLAGYTPQYSEDLAEMLIKKCPRIDGKTKKQCPGAWVVPKEDVERGIITKIVCNHPGCRRYKPIIWRWVASGDRRKLYFNSKELVDFYATRGRSFYGTLSIHDNKIIAPKSHYVNEKLVIGTTLGIDIDIIEGTICDSGNKEDMQKTIDLVRENLDTFVPNSYNMQTSGNGVYFLIHHDLCRANIFPTMAKFNGWLIYLDALRQEKGITKTKIDPLNSPGRLFKMFGSPHQRYDLVCVPLLESCNITKMENKEFKLKNFDIANYIEIGNNGHSKLNFYDRCDKRETKALYQFLEEHSLKSPDYGDRALRYRFKEITEILTGEEQPETSEEIDEKIDRLFGWEEFRADSPGRVHYRKKDGMFIVQSYGKDHDQIIKEFREKMCKKDKV